jgi:phosphohistidine phosphatase
MDLILWRHAEAHALPEGTSDARSDLERKLTARGDKQAARMAEWLDRQLPGSARTLVSPARRCEQTALALGRKFKTLPELAPGATLEALLEVVQWPIARVPMLVIGHQPTLGQTVARLLGLADSDCAFKKGAVWWLRTREREGQIQTVVVTVQSPDML